MNVTSDVNQVRIAIAIPVESGTTETATSLFDRVSSLLISLILIVGLLVIGMFSVWMTTDFEARENLTPPGGSGERRG